jgi:hypothetical protein|tara:strand:- start:1520 stop:1759 length:240 start_codon:yes stop_codon:yes gene_type:complete
MMYYTSTKTNCEKVSKKQNAFFKYPNDKGTLSFDTPYKLQNSRKYTLCIDETFYTTLTETEKSKCSIDMPVGYQWDYEN